MQGQASSLIFLVLLVAIFYFLLIRPQKKRVEQHRRLIDSVDVGDEVVTIGGMYGTVATITDEDFELEVAPGTRLRFVKSAIARRVAEDVDEDEPDEGEPDETADVVEPDVAEGD
jgi:preprotein translocase subunit YajC